MLRFSTSKIIATIGVHRHRPAARRSEHDDAASSGRSFQRSLPGWVPSWIVPTRAIVLGLDLQGGSHVLLEVDVARPHARRQIDDQLRDDVRRVLRDNRASRRRAASSSPPRGAQLRVPDAAERDRRAAEAARTVAADRQRRPRPGRRPRHRRSPMTPGRADPRSPDRERASTSACAAPSTRPSRSSAAASTRSARPSRASSARAPTASWCRCRACRTRSG